MLLKNNQVFKNFGPALLAIALGIGSGEFILWPFMTANYGFGVLWGALLGITLQFLIITIIQKHTVLLGKNIIEIFSKIFPYAALWVIVSTILGFGWPAFASIIASLASGAFNLGDSYFLPIALLVLILSAGILTLSKNSYKRILTIQKLNMSILLILSFFLFIFYFNINSFTDMILGFFGLGGFFGQNYWLIPPGIGMASFLAAIAYAGSGGNLLLANSFYILKERKADLQDFEKDKKGVLLFKKLYKIIFSQNLVFFLGGGILILALLSYISAVSLQGIAVDSSDFSFLVLEAEVFSKDISPWVAHLFILSGIFALFGVQLGILDFIGRISKASKNTSKKYATKISDDLAYKASILITALFGILILVAGLDQPKMLLITGAVINAFAMGVIALLLFFIEKNIIGDKFRSKKALFYLLFSALFYFLFSLYVVYEKVF